MVSALRGGGVNQMRKEILFLMGHLREKEYYREKIERVKRMQVKKTEGTGKGGVRGRTAGSKRASKGGMRNKRKL